MLAIITGATGGIGQAVAKAFARKGYNVAICFNENKEAAEALAYEITRGGGIACAFSADLKSEQHVLLLEREIIERMGEPDVLIINISSMWGQTGGSCEVVYSASKAALIGMTRALAKEVGPSNIRVNCIAPGVIDTPMNANHSEETMQGLAEETPLQRIGSPEDIANAAVFLAGPRSSFITGQVLGVNGGLVI